MVRAASWLMVGCTLQSGTDSRSGIQIGQESGQCEVLQEAWALDEVAPSGVVPQSVVATAYALATISFEGGASAVPLQLSVELSGAYWVSLVPLNPDAECPSDWLQVDLTLSMQTDDGSLDETIATDGEVLVEDGVVVTRGREPLPVAGLVGTWMPEAREVVLEWEIDDAGGHSGRLLAEDVGLADWSAAP